MFFSKKLSYHFFFLSFIFLAFSQNSKAAMACKDLIQPKTPERASSTQLVNHPAALSALFLVDSLGQINFSKRGDFFDSRTTARLKTSIYTATIQVSGSEPIVLEFHVYFRNLQNNGKKDPIWQKTGTGMLSVLQSGAPGVLMADFINSGISFDQRDPNEFYFESFVASIITPWGERKSIHFEFGFRNKNFGTEGKRDRWVTDSIQMVLSTTDAK